MTEKTTLFSFHTLRGSNGSIEKLKGPALAQYSNHAIEYVNTTKTSNNKKSDGLVSAQFNGSGHGTGIRGNDQPDNKKTVVLPLTTRRKGSMARRKKATGGNKITATRIRRVTLPLFPGRMNVEVAVGGGDRRDVRGDRGRSCGGGDLLC